MDGILDKGFVTDIHTSRAATVRAFKARVSKASGNNKARSHWKAAWKNFKTESSYFIFTLKCIRRGDKLAKDKCSSYRIVYKRETAKRFIPYFQSKLSYTKGKARVLSHS